MSNQHRIGWLSAVLLALFLNSLACNFPGRSAAESTELPTIPVTTQAVESLQSTIDSAKEAFQNNQPIEVQVTETQLTSMAAIELQSDPETPLSEPQIYLRDGQVSIYASLTQKQIAVPLEIILHLSADEQGILDYEITKSQIGPLPMPENLLSQLTSRLDEIIARQTTVEDSSLFIESISISDGILTLRGHKR